MFNNPFLHNPIRPEESIAKQIVDFLQFFVVIIAFFVVSYLFLFIPNQVDGNSMLPNFVNGELIFTNKIGHMLSDTDLGKGLDLNYKRGDVVVFQNPGFEPFIKRIIALPNDEVKFQFGKVYINGREIIEDYIPVGELTNAYDLEEGETNIVPENRFLLLGDNRNNSQDSRFKIIGFVHKDYLKGKVFLRYTKCNETTLKCSFTLNFVQTGKIAYR